MVLPLYFAIFSDEFTKIHENSHKIAAMGCTFGAEEMIWRDPIPADMLVVDDSVLPQSEPQRYVQSLLRLLEDSHVKHIVFDFERPHHPLCAQFLQEICKLDKRDNIVPPTYAQTVPDALIMVTGEPCNCWAQFCSVQREKYADRWCLEVVPWRYRVCDGRRLPCPEGMTEQFHHKNKDALCITGQAGESFYFFDNDQTLQEKLNTAGQYGCQLAVGIGAELWLLLA